MTGDAGALLLTMVGGMVTRLALTGAHRRYVKAGMGPFLVAAGLLLVVVGLLLLFRRGGDVRGDDHHDHVDDDHHGQAPRIGWLLLAPLVVLVLVAPAPLGSFAVANRVRQLPVSSNATYEALAPGTTVEMSIREYTERAADRDGASLRGVTVRLVGFVSPGQRGPFALARYQIACCAGDAVASLTDVSSWDGPAPPSDAWLRLEGVHEPGGLGAALRPTSYEVIEPPDDPYEE